MHTQYEDRRRVRRTIIILFISFAVLIIVYLLGTKIENNQAYQERGNLKEDFSTYKRVKYDGKTYRSKNSIMPILLIGIDKYDEDIESVSYRNGGQADFIMLIVIDDTERTVHLLQIDRDTMTNFVVLGVLGDEIGTRYSQICLSHGFGNNPAQNCEYTLKAVNNLLGSEEIEFYIAMNLDSICVINDYLGGVTVKIEDDFSWIDPTMVIGESVKLAGKQAEYYVRRRIGMSESSNAARMRRQKEYITAVVLQLSSMFENNMIYAEKILTDLEPYFFTNLDIAEIFSEIIGSYGYLVEEVVNFPGKHVIGEDGFVEFYPDNDSVIKWVLDVLYKEEN